MADAINTYDESRFEREGVAVIFRGRNSSVVRQGDKFRFDVWNAAGAQKAFPGAGVIGERERRCALEALRGEADRDDSFSDGVNELHSDACAELIAATRINRG